MAITGRTATVAEQNVVTGITATLPTDRQSGDLCIVVFACDSTVANFTGPGGSWVELKAPMNDATGANLIAAYYQFTPGSAPAASTSGATGRWTALCQSYSGVDTTTPIDVTQQTTTGNGTSLAATGVTTVTDGALLLSAYMVDSASRTLTQPGSMTMVKSYTPSAGGQAIALADETQATAGASGTRTWSINSTALDQTAFVTALRPAGGVSGAVTQAVTATATAAGILAAVGAVTQAVTATATAAGNTGRVQLVQDNEALGTAAASSVTVTSSAATAGNVLWVAYGGDKDAGTITGPSGFTQVANDSSTSVSFGLWWKVAAGGENSYTVSRSLTAASSDRLWVGEFSQDGTGAWTIHSSATHYTDESTVTSWASGTASDPGRSCAAIAAFGIDSGGSATSGQAFSGSFTELNPYGATGAGIAVGWKDLVAAGGTVSTTHSYTGTADQVSGAVATFSRVGAYTGEATSTVTAGVTADGTVAAGGVTGEVTQAITAGATGAGLLDAVGATAQAVTAGVTATGAVGVPGAVTAQVTAGGTVTGYVGAAGVVASAVTASTVVDGDVAAPPFPLSPLPITVLMWIGGVWTDITGYVYGRDAVPISITRGRSSEQASPERSTMTLHLDNRDGRFSPRNPTGPYYGQLTRNTQVSVIIEEGGAYLDMPSGVAGPMASTPDAAGLDITGDIDLRVDLYADDWTVNGDLISKYLISTNQRSWHLYCSDGYLQMIWSTDGTFGTVPSPTPASTVRVPMSGPGRLAVRATLDVDNGMGGWTVRFYTANTMDGPWRQLGRDVTGTGVTSIFNSTTDVIVGDAVSSTFPRVMGGRVYSAEIRDGIDGTLVANPIFSGQIVGATTFFDAQSNTWTLAGGTSLTNSWTRFVGEVSEWPQKWDPSGSDAWVPITVSGIMRRLGQGQSPVQSTFRSAMPARADLVAYWPCEDGTNATSVAAGSPSTRPLTASATTANSLRFAANSDFPCSAPLPTMGTGRFDGTVPAVAETGELQMSFLLSVASGGGTDGSQVVKLYTTGTAAKWKIEYGTLSGGSLRVSAFDANDVELFVTAWINYTLDGRPTRMSLELTQDGSDIDWVLSSLPVGNATGGSGSGTLSSRTVGAAVRLVVGKHNDLGNVAIGHIVIENNVSSIFDVYSELNAYLFETAGRRMERLCAENGVTFVPYGDLDRTVQMGYQVSKTFLDMVKDCAVADGGILFEPRDVLGIAYRTRESVQRQNPTVTLGYTDHQMSEIEPVEDDRFTRNRVQVTREDGTSRTAELTSGPMSTATPPSGVGRYDTAVTLSLGDDQDVEHQAYWRLAAGTVDEARYPTIRVNLASTHLSGDTAMIRDLISLEPGDRIDVTDPPVWVPPDDIRQIVQGCTERLGQYVHEIALNLAPESPYRVAVFDDDVSRYTSDGSELTSDITSGATSVSVTTGEGPVWTHDDGDFDIMIGGERITVTAVSGATSPQTFTVTRAVNGVAKAHSAGAEVQLFEPYRYGL